MISPYQKVSFYSLIWAKDSRCNPSSTPQQQLCSPCLQNRELNAYPLATVQKIVTEILPPSSGLAFGKDARDLLIECCVEFITLISSEANEISEKESKKTIACEHITKALEQLGFGEYVQDIMDVASEHKEQLKVCVFGWRRRDLRREDKADEANEW